MKKIILTLTIQLLVLTLIAQNQIYNPQADTKKDLENAIIKAKTESKHVLVQVGGNWCPWCIKLHNLFQSDSTLNDVIAKNYVLIKVNYSKENKNLDVLRILENPKRFGFPVLVILDDNGKRIHTQDSGLLESGDGYDRKKVLGFLKNWTKTAINLPAN